jgi:hypothetical protein
MSNLITLTEFGTQPGWPPESTLRSIYRKRASNGMAAAFFGGAQTRRILVDTEIFWELLRQRPGGQKSLEPRPYQKREITTSPAAQS